MTRVLVIALCALTLIACKREARELRLDPPVAEAFEHVATMPNGIGGAPPDVAVATGKPYTSNAFQLSQGKRLFEWFNCTGCHANGGGATGPAFLDGWWRYGPDTVSVFVSIRDGRPRGMPSYRDKMTTEQIWQLAGYVQTIGMYAPSAAAPGRNDAMHARPSENRAPAGADIRAPSR